WLRESCAEDPGHQPGRARRLGQRTHRAGRDDLAVVELGALEQRRLHGAALVENVRRGGDEIRAHAQSRNLPSHRLDLVQHVRRSRVLLRARLTLDDVQRVRAHEDDVEVVLAALPETARNPEVWIPEAERLLVTL